MKKISLLLLSFSLVSVIKAQTQARLVLAEQFTNSGCPICANHDHWVSDFTENNPSDAVEISYHANFPYNDSMYYDNPTENSARVNYYSVSGVPWSIIDGNVYSNGTSSLGSSISTVVSNRKMAAPDYYITSSGITINGNVLSGSIIFTSADSANPAKNLTAHIVAFEKNVLKSSYNGNPGNNSQTIYKNVMRKMIPDQNGTSLTNKIIGNSDTVTFSWNINKVKNINELALACFVQDEGNQEVLQAASFPIVNLSVNNELKNEMPVVFYPNPASEAIYLQAPGQSAQQECIITLKDLQGKTALSFKAVIGHDAKLFPLQGLNAGTYFIQFNMNNGAQFVKKIIVR